MAVPSSSSKQSARLGGAVATEELTLPGFRHDTFSAVYPAAAASPVFARMPLARYGLRWMHPPVAMAHPFLDGRAAALYRDLNQTVDNLDRLTPGDGQAWRALIAPYRARIDAALQQTTSQRLPADWRRPALLTGLGVGGTLEFARLALLSAESLAAERFRGTYRPRVALRHGDARRCPAVGSRERARRLLSALPRPSGRLAKPGGWREKPVELPSSAISPRSVAETRTDTAVTRIVVEGSRATGIVTANGRDDTVRRSLIGDVTPHGLLRLAGARAAVGVRDADDALPVWAADLQGRLGARRAGAVDRAGSAGGGHRPCRRHGR